MTDQRTGRSCFVRIIEQQVVEIAWLRQIIGELTGRIGRLETDLAQRDPTPGLEDTNYTADGTSST